MRAGFLVLAALLAACGPGGSDPDRAPAQEPITDVEFLAPPNVDNPVAFGSSLHDHPELRAEALAQISDEVNGRLPGIRFTVVRGPVLLPPGQSPVISYRVWGEEKYGRSDYAVLGWYPSPTGLEIPGLPWEVEHMVLSIDDYANPSPP